MGQFLIRRSLVGILTLLGASVMIFFVLRVMPGDVAKMILIGREGEGQVTGLALDTLRETLGLDRPLIVQYLTWIGEVVRGDLGESLFTGDSIASDFARRVPLTLQLAFMAEVIAVVIGIPLGVITAVKQDTWADFVLRLWAIFWIAVPTFWVAILVIILGLRWFTWIPPLGYHPIMGDFAENMKQMVWPALILAMHEMARYARMTRSSTLEVLRQDYVRTARAKGLREYVVLYRHVLKNALIPVITFGSVYFGAHLGGTVVLEWIFNIPGMGSWFVDSIYTRDFPVVQSVILFIIAAFIVVNVLVDMSYGWLDPRIRVT
ncbi:MAG: ABC transporter permease [Dehalococcoidia bacterium]